MRRTGPTIYLETDGSGEIEIVLVNGNGDEYRPLRTTPGAGSDPRSRDRGSSS